MQNLLFQFLLNSVQELCSYHVPSFSVAAWRLTRRDFGRPRFDAVYCHYYEQLFYSAVTNLNGFWEAQGISTACM